MNVGFLELNMNFAKLATHSLCNDIYYYIIFGDERDRQCHALILNLDLNSTLRRVSCDVESRHGIFQGESVRDEGLEIDQPSSHQANCLWVLS